MTFSAALHGDSAEIEKEILTRLEEVAHDFESHLTGSWFNGSTVASTNLTNTDARSEPAPVDESTGAPVGAAVPIVAPGPVAPEDPATALQDLQLKLETGAVEEVSKLHVFLSDALQMVEDHLGLAHPISEPPVVPEGEVAATPQSGDSQEAGSAPEEQAPPAS